VEKAAFLRVKEIHWRQTRLAKAQSVPTKLSFASKPKRRRPKFTDEELQEEMEQKAADESDQDHLDRLCNVYEEIVEFNNMLALEGEDCWDEESDDSFDQKVQDQFEEMHLEHNTCMKVTAESCLLNAGSQITHLRCQNRMLFFGSRNHSLTISDVDCKEMFYFKRCLISKDV
jgi:hypothetical protein